MGRGGDGWDSSSQKRRVFIKIMWVMMVDGNGDSYRLLVVASYVSTEKEKVQKR